MTPLASSQVGQVQSLPHGDESLAPHACSNCKHGHRKCDRKLPTCGYCAEKRKACSFDEPPQKRGPKKRDGKDKARFQPYNSPEAPRQNNDAVRDSNYQFFHFHQTPSAQAPQMQPSVNSNHIASPVFANNTNFNQQIPITNQFNSMQKNFNPPQYGNGNMYTQDNFKQEMQFNSSFLPIPPVTTPPQSSPYYQQSSPIVKTEQRFPSPTRYSISPNTQSLFSNNSPSSFNDKDMGNRQIQKLPPMSALHQLPQSAPQLSPSALLSQFHFLYLNTPVVDKRRAESILTYISTHPHNTSKFIPTSDDIALVLAAQSMFYFRPLTNIGRFFKRYQQRADANRCFVKSRELVSQSFDHVLVNFNLVATFAYLAIYLVEDGEIDVATFYTDCVASYCRRIQGRIIGKDLESHLQHVRNKYVNLLMCTGSHYMKDAYDLGYLFKCFILSHFLSKEYRKLNDCLVVDETKDSTGRIIDMITEDVFTGSNLFNITETIVDKITEKCQQTFNSADMRPEEDICNKTMMALVIAQGLKLQMLHVSGRSGIETADYLTALMGTATFNYSLYVVAQPCAIAMLTHIRALEAGVGDQAQLLELLKKDTRAMVLLMEKYKKAKTHFAALKARAENIITFLEMNQENGNIKLPPTTIKDDLPLIGQHIGDTSTVNDEELELFLVEFLMNDALSSMNRRNRGTTPTDEILFL